MQTGIEKGSDEGYLKESEVSIVIFKYIYIFLHPVLHFNFELNFFGITEMYVFVNSEHFIHFLKAYIL